MFFLLDIVLKWRLEMSVNIWILVLSIVKLFQRKMRREYCYNKKGECIVRGRFKEGRLVRFILPFLPSLEN